MMGAISDWFWNEDVWLPPGYKWDDFKISQLTSNNTVTLQPHQFAQFSDLLYPIPMSLVLIMLRLVVTRYVFRPLAVWLGLKQRPGQCHQDNSVLESVYRRQGGTKLSPEELSSLADQCGMSVIQVLLH